MNKTRLEAFSDGVFAIIITIMVLELKIPEGTSAKVILPLLPVLGCYAMSFAYVGIYWVNHHHLLHTVRAVNAQIMWANLFLLFWLSLIPFATGWMGINNFQKITVATYGGLLIICGVAFTLLSAAIVKSHKQETELSKAIYKNKFKSNVSTLLYVIAIPVSLFLHPLISALLYVVVAIIWIIPSKAIEDALQKEEHQRL